MKNMTNIRSKWDFLCGKLWALNRDECFDILNAHYSEPHRHYHNFDHIIYCLDLADKVRGLNNKHCLELELAIWFHDIVYSVTEPNNEEKSVIVFNSSIDNLNAKVYVSKVKINSLILRTKTHKQTNSSSSLSNLMSDIDLAILGDEPEKYDVYEKNIREEYSFVPIDAYQAARSNILNDFLLRDHIYHTSLLKPREKMARANLQRAINNLCVSQVNNL